MTSAILMRFLVHFFPLKLYDSVIIVWDSHTDHWLLFTINIFIKWKEKLKYDKTYI